jgi:hypothetical protein
MLIEKVDMIGKIRLQLVQFYQNLKKEEQLQQLYAQRVEQREIEEENLALPL